LPTDFGSRESSAVFLRFRLTSLSGCAILKLALQIVSGDWATPKMMKQGFFISSAYQTRRSARADNCWLSQFIQIKRIPAAKTKR
jgi:hypothetical protein